MPAPFSKAIEYEKPEHPPPTTPTRRPAGTGFCCAMVSFTLAMALAVRLMGAFFVSAGFTSGVVVAMGISLKGLVSIITKPEPAGRQSRPGRTFPGWFRLTAYHLIR